MTHPIRVGIALVERGGSFLVRQRPDVPGSPMPGYWEFPGGKCGSDESPEAAAVRECWEETGLHVSVRGLRRSVEHDYPHGFVQLHYFDCAPLDATAEPGDGTGFMWLPARALLTLTFPDANDLIVAELAGSGVDP